MKDATEGQCHIEPELCICNKGLILHLKYYSIQALLMKCFSTVSDMPMFCKCNSKIQVNFWSLRHFWGIINYAQIMQRNINYAARINKNINKYIRSTHQVLSNRIMTCPYSNKFWYYWPFWGHFGPDKGSKIHFGPKPNNSRYLKVKKIY